MRKLRAITASGEEMEIALDELTEKLSETGVEENDVVSVKTMFNGRWYAEALYWTSKA